MKENLNKKGNYYAGGFAEMVSNPTALTYTYLKKWFSGRKSLGGAMEILGLPYQKIEDPILELVDEELLVNLKVEEETLYKNTIFKYEIQKDLNQTPKLTIDPLKLLNPLNWINTLSILIKQSIWISKPDRVLKLADDLVKNIPEVSKGDFDEQILEKKIWPNVLALGILSEFFHQLIKQQSEGDNIFVQRYISSKLASKDWFFLSIFKISQVKEGKLSFREYLEEYGIRADKDYELTCPRWIEIPQVIINRISKAKKFPEVDVDDGEFEKLSNKLKLFVETFIQLQILRSEAKRKTLLAIYQLRSKLGKTLDKQTKVDSKSSKGKIKFPLGFKGEGIGISEGEVSGFVKHINDNDEEIPGSSICIFQSSSPEFSSQFPKCLGIIFLKGGQTSHGAIVTREFGIPALVDNKAADIEEKTLVTINGEKGTWEIGGDIKNNPLKKATPEFVKSSNLDSILGGKANALTKLLDLGLPIPSFFVVTSDIFRKYYGKEMPENIKKKILKKFDSLETKWVSVRSSALAEDSSKNAWAGQLETYLYVSKDDLLAKIKQCWSSIKSKRALEYAHRKGVEKGELLMAVIVQKMINSDVSGVMFSQNPVTKNKDEIVIEAGLGLGEMIVQGDFEPARFVIDKKTEDIKSKTFGNQEKMLVFDGETKKEVEIKQEIGKNAILNEKNINELSEIAKKIENYFKSPQDIEWAIEKENLYILQSRPITA